MDPPRYSTDFSSLLDPPPAYAVDDCIYPRTFHCHIIPGVEEQESLPKSTSTRRFLGQISIVLIALSMLEYLLINLNCIFSANTAVLFSEGHALFKILNIVIFFFNVLLDLTFASSVAQCISAYWTIDMSARMAELDSDTELDWTIDMGPHVFRSCFLLIISFILRLILVIEVGSMYEAYLGEALLMASALAAFQVLLHYGICEVLKSCRNFAFSKRIEKHFGPNEAC